MKAKDYLRQIIANDKEDKHFYVLDAIGYFFFNFDDSGITDPYKHRWTDSKEKADEIYVTCSQILLDQEFYIIEVLNDNNADDGFMEFLTEVENQITKIIEN